MKRTSTVLLSVACGLLLALGSAGAANAYVSQSYSKSGIERTYISYYSEKNTLYASDQYSDGYGARAYWRTSNGVAGNLDNSNGYASMPTSKVIPGTSGTMYFKACIKNGGVDAGCNTYDTSTTL